MSYRTNPRESPPGAQPHPPPPGLIDSMQRMQIETENDRLPPRRSRPGPSARLSMLIDELKALLAKLGSQARRTAAEAIIKVGRDVLESTPPVAPIVDDPANAVASSMKPFLVPRKGGREAMLEDRFGDQFPFTLPFPILYGYSLFLDSLSGFFKTPWTVLPSDMANMVCFETPEQLLAFMNMVFGTSKELSPDMRDVFSELMDTGGDLGYVYGCLRRFWRLFGDNEMPATPGERGPVGQFIQDLKQEDYDMRASAISGNHISGGRMPPRRLWDLYSNRVLPYYVTRDQRERAGWVHQWTPISPVSHSWRPESERQSVLTTINGKAWHVPIPRGTNLNNIRNELLSLGAEYVFLDVLCLRQYDALRPRAEAVRKKEWRLDIPTLSHVYISDHVIVYLNGLGLPFRDGPVDPQDRYHWANRVWTLQEHSRNLIIAGTNTKPANIDRQLYALLLDAPIYGNMQQLCAALRGRSYSNPIDQVASVAIFLCHPLPIYDSDTSPEVAWDLLVETMHAHRRTDLLFTDFGPRTKSDGSWWPTWDQFINCTMFTQLTTTSYCGWHSKDWPLQFLSGSSPSFGSRDGLDAYCHHAYVLEGCRITPDHGPSKGDLYTVTDRHGNCYHFQPSTKGDFISQRVIYTLVTLRGSELEYPQDPCPFVIAEPKGVRRVNRERALALMKVSVVKWSAPKGPEAEGTVYRNKRLIVWC